MRMALRNNIHLCLSYSFFGLSRNHRDNIGDHIITNYINLLLFNLILTLNHENCLMSRKSHVLVGVDPLLSSQGGSLGFVWTYAEGRAEPALLYRFICVFISGGYSDQPARMSDQIFIVNIPIPHRNAQSPNPHKSQQIPIIIVFLLMIRIGKAITPSSRIGSFYNCPHPSKCRPVLAWIEGKFWRE
jgi:hypothetical protein